VYGALVGAGSLWHTPRSPGSKPQEKVRTKTPDIRRRKEQGRNIQVPSSDQSFATHAHKLNFFKLNFLKKNLYLKKVFLFFSFHNPIM
jgi:hypothetical protein